MFRVTAGVLLAFAVVYAVWRAAIYFYQRSFVLPADPRQAPAHASLYTGPSHRYLPAELWP